LHAKLKEEKLIKNNKKGYMKPIELQMNLTLKLRKEKTTEKGIREEIRKKFFIFLPFYRKSSYYYLVIHSKTPLLLMKRLMERFLG